MIISNFVNLKHHRDRISFDPLKKGRDVLRCRFLRRLLLPAVCLYLTVSGCDRPQLNFEDEVTMKLERHDYSGALDLLKQETKKNPESGVSHFNYGALLFSRGLYHYQGGDLAPAQNYFSESERQLAMAIDLFQENQEASVLLSQAHVMLGDLNFLAHDRRSEALSHYQKALQLNPTMPEAKEGIQYVESEYLMIEIDRAAWQLALHTETEKQAVRQYVPVGLTVWKWKEMLVVELHRWMQHVPLEKWAERIREDVQKSCPLMDWKIVRQEEDRILYEWEVQNCLDVPSVQAEIGMVRRGAEGIHMVRYESKTAGIPQDVRALWLERFQKSSLQKFGE